MKKGLVTTRGFRKLSSGHPWIYANDLEDQKLIPSRPTLVHFGEHWFFNSPQSQIRLRRFGPTTRGWLADERSKVISDPLQFSRIFHDYLVEHFKALYQQKLHLVNHDSGEVPAFRWIFSENDLVPGLTVDVLGEAIIAELTTAPIEHFWFAIKPALEKALSDLGLTGKIFEVRDNPIRQKEGLVVVETENPPTPFWLKWNGLEWWVAPASRQKTGFYLDQKFNHVTATQWAARLGKKTALDLFTFQGGFGLHLAKAGLKVKALDQSADALAIARKNVEKNGLSDFTTEEANVFEWIRNSSDQADVVILDPPALVGIRENIDNAIRGLIDLHGHALDRLAPGGLLVTCTCSQAFTEEVLTRVVRESAHGRRRQMRILERRGPSPDHAPIPNFVEGDYLRAFYILVD